MGFAEMFFSVVSAVGIRMQIQMRNFVSHDFLLCMATVFGIWITPPPPGQKEEQILHHNFQNCGSDNHDQNIINQGKNNY
ncbi:MAG: hypothetical protein OXM00_00660 [Paracoccaceae bacterium]|nr:hypothetical protein [Paracoccaceae bacterium]